MVPAVATGHDVTRSTCYYYYTQDGLSILEPALPHSFREKKERFVHVPRTFFNLCQASMGRKAQYLVDTNLYIKKNMYIHLIGIQCYSESEKYPENDAFSVIQN